MERQTTVTIDQKTTLQLDRLAKANGVTKKDFLSCALDYFEKYGINPVKHESPAKEMEKLIKRSEQVIAFIRQQEKEFLRPACEAMFNTQKYVQKISESVPDKKEINQKFSNIDGSIFEARQMIFKTTNSQEQAFQKIAKLIDAKEKTGIFGDISKAYKQ